MTKRCELCRDVGFVLNAEENVTRECSCGIAGEERVRRVIPPRWRDKTLSTLRVDHLPEEKAELLESAVERGREFVANFSHETARGLLFVGPVGCGKTHVAMAICAELLRAGFTAKVGNFAELLREVRGTFSGASELTDNDILEPWQSADLVLLDDVGADAGSDFSAGLLWSVLETRLDAGKPSIFTTNCNSIELASRVGDRNVSRLFEAAKVVSLPPLPDYRRKVLAAR